jgi:hypothetical protein
MQAGANLVTVRRSQKTIFKLFRYIRAKFDIGYSELPEDAVNFPEILLQSLRSK